MKEFTNEQFPQLEMMVGEIENKKIFQYKFEIDEENFSEGYAELSDEEYEVFQNVFKRMVSNTVKDGREIKGFKYPASQDKE